MKEDPPDKGKLNADLLLANHPRRKIEGIKRWKSRVKTKIDLDQETKNIGKKKRKARETEKKLEPPEKMKERKSTAQESTLLHLHHLRTLSKDRNLKIFRR